MMVRVNAGWRGSNKDAEPWTRVPYPQTVLSSAGPRWLSGTWFMTTLSETQNPCCTWNSSFWSSMHFISCGLISTKTCLHFLQSTTVFFFGSAQKLQYSVSMPFLLKTDGGKGYKQKVQGTLDLLSCSLSPVKKDAELLWHCVFCFAWTSRIPRNPWKDLKINIEKK